MWHVDTRSDIAGIPLLLSKDALSVHLCALCSSLTKRILLDLIRAPRSQRLRRADSCREYVVSQHVNWKFGTWKNRLIERQNVVNGNENIVRATCIYVKVFLRPAPFASTRIQISQAILPIHTRVHFHNTYTCTYYSVTRLGRMTIDVIC
jgi:hypothetical protein